MIIYVPLTSNAIALFSYSSSFCVNYKCSAVGATRIGINLYSSRPATRSQLIIVIIAVVVVVVVVVRTAIPI